MPDSSTTLSPIQYHLDTSSTVSESHSTTAVYRFWTQLSLSLIVTVAYNVHLHFCFYLLLNLFYNYINKDLDIVLLMVRITEQQISYIPW